MIYTLDGNTIDVLDGKRGLISVTTPGMFNDIINTPITKIICSVKVEKVLNGNTVQVGDGKREIVSVATPGKFFCFVLEDS